MNIEIKQLAAKNDNLNADIIEKVSVFSNVWMTLIAPIIVGIFISYWFSKSDGNIALIEWVFVAVFLSIHCFLAFFQHKVDKKYHTFPQIIALYDKYNAQVETYNKLRLSHQNTTDLSIAQITTLYLISAELDKAVGDLNKELHKEIERSDLKPPLPLYDSLEALMDKHLTNLLWPLVVKKGDLFSYKEQSLYNIALYAYNDSSAKLEVKKRFYDERISVKNRDWRPGIGHVGMTFLHKAIKCCPNIQNSTELTVTSERDSKYYCSFISVPILACEDDEQTDNNPHGVLVLTSAMESQFNLARDQFFLQAISKMLAVYLDKQEHARKMVSIIQMANGSARGDEK
jgi:hypothetical protein